MMKHSMKEWLIAVRPWSFPASAMPVLVTLMYLYWAGYESLNWLAGVWALVNIVIFHAAGNKKTVAIFSLQKITTAEFFCDESQFR